MKDESETIIISEGTKSDSILYTEKSLLKGSLKLQNSKCL